ncbi:MAG: ribonuclease HI [Gammaproteobacteria bacterium]
MSSNRVEIFTDGACRGNPGPGGWGALLKSGDQVRELKGGEANTTNNRMELQAAIEGLAVLKQSSQVDLTTDSQYVRKGITEWIQKWRQNGWKTAGGSAVKNRDLWQKLDTLQSEHEVAWHWVKGHSGHPENERVDALANAAIDELMAR